MYAKCPLKHMYVHISRAATLFSPPTPPTSSLYRHKVIFIPCNIMRMSLQILCEYYTSPVCQFSTRHTKSRLYKPTLAANENRRRQALLSVSTENVQTNYYPFQTVLITSPITGPPSSSYTSVSGHNAFVITFLIAIKLANILTPLTVSFKTSAHCCMKWKADCVLWG